MELIFFYVNQSRTKFIEKQGFNFSSRYKFSVEYDKGTYILKGFECENPLPQNFFDETGCITNVTAVVGENGSGKTTLLTKLLGYSGQVKDKDHAPEYDAFFAEEYEIDKAISIYWDGNDLVCYHNIDEFENDTELLKENRVFYLTQGSDLLANMIANDKGFFDISKICVSSNRISCSPHDLKLHTDDLLTFDYFIKGPDFLTDKEQIGIEIDCTFEFEDNVRVLKLNDVYQIHTDLVQECIKKSIVFNPDYLEDLCQTYDGLFESKEDLYRIVFGNYKEETEYGKRPLSKLTKDILSSLYEDIYME